VRRKKLFEIKPGDSSHYEEKIRDFLPERIIDMHAHVYLSRFQAQKKAGPERNVSWPSRVASQNPAEDLKETYRLLLPGKKVTPVLFSSLSDRADDFDAANAYTAKAATSLKGHAFLFVRPDWSADELESRLDEAPFKGIKVYLSLSDPKIKTQNITIFDFLPQEHLRVADKQGLIIILHIPRSGRLKDPVNIKQLLEIDVKYPGAKAVIAHTGRAYCNEDIGDSLEVLSKSRNLLFDTSANTNAWVFARLMEAAGPKRILFGSDLPITRMRMRRITENGRYINLVPRGLYGDVSGDPNMRDVSSPESDGFTFFLYEEIAAVLSAARETGLTKQDIEAIFYGNAKRILGGKE
jgi:predicted TIM-barrel fold metal-dependent hydrolase